MVIRALVIRISSFTGIFKYLRFSLFNVNINITVYKNVILQVVNIIITFVENFYITILMSVQNNEASSES